MNFNLAGKTLDLTIEAVIIAGFTGRDQTAVQAHITELAAEGVTVPRRVPSFYLAPANALVQTDAIVTTHDKTSGEAEIALVVNSDEIFVTLVSDHTDRAVETMDIAVSKLVCPKVIASSAWRFEEVESVWDSLLLSSWILEGGERVCYQEGSASELLAPSDLLERIPFRRRPDSYALLTGTLAANGGIRGSERFWAELRDPTSGRSIQLEYAVRVMADVLETAT